MKSIRTEQFNQPLGENQEEYNTLFINLNTADPMCPATVCFEFDQAEVNEFNKTHKLYYNQCLFLKQVEIEGELVNVPAHQFHPMNISVYNPLEPMPEVKETRGPKDVDYISDDPDEIRTAAKACGVLPTTIHVAKHMLGTNDRSAIYSWVNAYKGSSFTFDLK